MRNEKISQPTESELEILQILWQEGPCTVRQVNDRLNERKKVGYTTTLKLMQIMVEKNILQRDQQQRSHLYRAAAEEKITRQQLLDRFLQTAFGGSAMNLVMQALGNHKASKEEISRIRELLDEIEGE
ncbi:MAG: BlaI/MecI/CopY family transcriptional regulator [bacterium]|nr:BlaI/MecI/CopY family transcriptional regulator [bacterium]